MTDRDMPIEVQQLRDAARFLVDRMNDWSADGLSDESAREWMGYVEPAIGRLAHALDELDAHKGETT